MFNLFKKRNTDTKKSDINVSTEYIEWRKHILGVQPMEKLKGISDELYGMLMDVGMGDRQGHFLAISIYAFNTGEASLKASPGAGIIGLGNIESVTGIPEKIIEAGQSLVHIAKRTDNFNYPEANKVHFFFITTSGIRIYPCLLSELQNGHPLNNIFTMFSEIKSAADKVMDEQNKKRVANQ